MLDKATLDFFEIFYRHIAKLKSGKNQIDQNRLILNAKDKISNIFPNILYSNDDKEVFSNYLIWSFNHLLNFSVTDDCKDDE